MTNDFNPELLSAYLDDECTPDEKHSVEALLADSPELRDELDSLRAVSKSVRTIPCEPAPDHLVSAVMQSLEREHLLGPPTEPVHRETPEVTQARSVPAVPARTSKTYWTTGIAAGALVICCVFLLQTQDGGDLAMELASDLDTSEALHPEAPAVFDSASKPQGFGRMIAADQGPAGFGGGGATALTVPRQSSPFPATAVDSAVGLQFPAPLSAVEVGDVIEAFQRNGDDVVVVKLTVVDRRAGLQKLQLLLARHLPLAGQSEVAAAGDDSIRSEESKDTDGKNQAAANDLLIAVLAEMPESELAETIAELRRDTLIGGLDITKGISNEALGAYAVAVDGIDVAAAEFDRQQILPESTPSPRILARSQAPGEQRRTEQTVTEDDKGGRQAAHRGVRTLLLKPELLQTNSAETAVAQSGSTADQPASGSAKPEVESGKPATRRPILFVLVDRPDRPAADPDPDPAPEAKNDEQGAS